MWRGLVFCCRPDESTYNLIDKRAIVSGSKTKAKKVGVTS